MVTTGDCGDIDIHPKKKEPIGTRLALGILSHLFCGKDEYSGPIIKNATLKNNEIELTFSHCDSGLKVIGDLGLFEVGNENNEFFEAKAQVLNNKVILKCNEVNKPQFVRYGWDIYYQIGLYNNENLPASPFLISI